MKIRPTIALVLFAACVLTGCANDPAPPVPASTSGPTSSAAITTATPGQPVVVDELGKGNQDAPVDVNVAGPAQVAFRKITIKPGGGTGLHCHDGQLIAVVENGVFTHYAPTYPTGKHVYVAGDSIVEGAHYVHQGKNEGTDDVVLLVTYIIPTGDPLAETDLSKCER
ncbi:MAG: cupin domain-containing protein [Microbacteriaceae bacterium]